MKYSIELSMIDFRKLLTEEQKCVYDDICNYYVDHHYDEYHNLEELMSEFAMQHWPDKYMQYIRQQAMQQHVANQKFNAKLRVKLELLELQEKIDKLDAFLKSENSKKLSELALQHLNIQITHMTDYANILQNRLSIDFKETTTHA